MNIEELSKIFVGDALVAASTQLLSGVPVDAGVLDAATKARDAGQSQAWTETEARQRAASEGPR